MNITRIPPDDFYPGMTRLEHHGRTIVCVGIGPEVEQACLEKAERVTDAWMVAQDGGHDGE